MLLACRQLEYIIFPLYCFSYSCVFMCSQYFRHDMALLPAWVPRIAKIKFSIKFKIDSLIDIFGFLN
jgi:hypothetical protein